MCLANRGFHRTLNSFVQMTSTACQSMLVSLGNIESASCQVISVGAAVCVQASRLLSPLARPPLARARCSVHIDDVFGDMSLAYIGMIGNCLIFRCTLWCQASSAAVTLVMQLVFSSQVAMNAFFYHDNNPPPSAFSCDTSGAVSTSGLQVGPCASCSAILVVVQVCPKLVQALVNRWFYLRAYLCHVACVSHVNVTVMLILAASSPSAVYSCQFSLVDVSATLNNAVGVGTVGPTTSQTYVVGVRDGTAQPNTLQVRTMFGSYNPAANPIPIVTSGGPTVIPTGSGSDAFVLSFASTIGHTTGTEWTIAASALLTSYQLINAPTLRCAGSFTIIHSIIIVIAFMELSCCQPIASRLCREYDMCAQSGLCDFQTGVCQCFSGYEGETFA